MAFNQFPYSNFHEMNLDWILNVIKNLENEWSTYKAINQIVFRGDWDITTQYPPYSVVKNDKNGYFALQAVPKGIPITNTDYWVMVYDYDQLSAELEQRVTTLEAAVGTLNEKIAEIPLNAISLKNPPAGFAKCDPTGATDSTEAFNAILAYARTNKIPILVDGVYKLNDTILLKTGDRFIGLGTNTSNYDTTTFTDLSGVISGFVFNGTDGFKAVERQASIILFNFAIINIGSKGNTIAIKGDRLNGSYIVHTQNVNFKTGLELGVDVPEFMNDNAMFNTIIGYGSVRCDTGIHLYGGSSGNFGGNACHNLFMDIGLDTYSVGILLDDSDNNTFIKCYCFQRGGDWAYQFNRNARSNYFYHLQGRVLTNNGKNNWIYGYDRENGQGMPYCPAGSLNIITSDGVFLMQKDNANRYFQSGKDYNYSGINPSSGSLAVNTDTSAGQPLFYVIGPDGNWKGQVTIT